MSALTLDSLSKALQLTQEERAYVFALANLYDPYTVRSKAARNTADNVEQAKQFVNELSRPGFVTNRRFDILALNQGARGLFRTFCKGAFGGEQNLLAHFFLNPEMKEHVRNWDACASRLCAKARFSMPVLMYDDVFCKLITRLESESEAFSAYWDQHEVSKGGIGVVDFAGDAEDTRSFIHTAFCFESSDSVIINIFEESH